MFYKKIYVANLDEVSSEIMDSFLMCGNKNWDHYFTKKDNNIDTEELNNVNFIELDNQSEFKDFIESIDYIDFSLENNRFGVLYYAKNEKT